MENEMKQLFVDVEKAMWKQVGKMIESGEMNDEMRVKIGEAMKMFPVVANANIEIAREADEIGAHYNGEQFYNNEGNW